MIDVRLNPYSFTENGITVEYVLFHQGVTNSDVPTSTFIPAAIPGYKKHNFFQSVKYRIENKDWFGKMEKVEQAYLRTNAWWNHAYKCVEILAIREESHQDIKPTVLRKAAVAQLVIDKIKSAKHIKMDGRISESNYERIFQAKVDDIVIDIQTGLVFKGEAQNPTFSDMARIKHASDVLFKIPCEHIPVVFGVLNDLRRKAIINGR